jgi:uncharacterized protein (TIGR02266 family)
MDEKPIEIFEITAKYLSLSRRQRGLGPPLSSREVEELTDLLGHLERSLGTVRGINGKRRRALRVPTQVAVRCHSQRGVIAGDLAQVSEDGALVQTGWPFEPGTTVRVELPARDDNDALFVEGVVVWSRVVNEGSCPAGMAIRFTEPNPTQRRHLFELIEEARRVRLGSDAT